jgi:hypothetical protein
MVLLTYLRTLTACASFLITSSSFAYAQNVDPLLAENVVERLAKLAAGPYASVESGGGGAQGFWAYQCYGDESSCSEDIYINLWTGDVWIDCTQIKTPQILAFQAIIRKKISTASYTKYHALRPVNAALHPC